MAEQRYLLRHSLVSIRCRLGLTQAQVAEAAGIDRTALYRIENGHRSPRPATVAALADALGVEVECITERAA